jgi:glycosyltransferase involved in cell wall biosynthesis
VRVLVYPNDIAIIGGSQINAIDLAAAVAYAGHEVTVFGIEGVLVDYIAKKGLRFVPARRLRYRPAPSRIVQLWSLARREGIDVIHTYEWPPSLDAYFGAHLVGGVPLVSTVLTMGVTPMVPDSVPLIMGTEELAARAREYRTGVSVLEPPIDTDADHPDIDGKAFRHENAVDDGDVLIVTVSRLSIDLKLDALVAAVDAAEILARRYPVRLVLVGDGDARPQLEARALEVNRRLGRPVVALTGSLTDPRPAYAAADVTVGMGSSALRAAAIGKPVVVQGEQGFSLPLEPATVDTFLWQGFWGTGDGPGGGDRLATQLEPLVADIDRRRRLGAYGRRLVTERFSLARATDLLVEEYTAAIAASADRRRPWREAVTMAGRAMALEIEQHRPSVKRARAAEEAAKLDAAERAATDS